MVVALYLPFLLAAIFNTELSKSEQIIPWTCEKYVIVSNYIILSWLKGSFLQIDVGSKSGSVTMTLTVLAEAGRGVE